MEPKLILGRAVSASRSAVLNSLAVYVFNDETLSAVIAEVTVAAIRLLCLQACKSSGVIVGRT